eukprot:502456_1
MKFITVSAFFILWLTLNLAEKTPNNFIDRIISRLLSYQFKETQEYQTGPVHLPEKQFELAGLFPTTVHINAIGNISFARGSIINDANFFTTAWILEFLFELKQLNVIKRHYNKRVIKAVKKAIPALHMFHNKNADKNDLSVSFWLQYKFENNQGKTVYCATSENLLNPFKAMTDSDIETIKFFLDMSHKDLSNILYGQYLSGYRRKLFASIIGIPSDFDDSSVALALTTQFMQHREYFGGKVSDLWLKHKWTKNIRSFADNLSKYCYRPLSGDKNVNVIDSRVYYWMRGFIEENKHDKDLAIVPTWEMTLDEIIYYKRNNICYQTPLFVNNIDVSVSANVIYALTRSLFTKFDDKYDTSKWFNDDIQRIYTNTTNLLLYAVQDNWINLRPEIVFLYY